MNNSFWKNKKVLITGDTGFKGAWLTFCLYRAGAQIQGYSSSDFSENSKLYKKLKLNSISNTIDGDIRNQKAVMRAFNDFQPEFVFHLAAQPLVRYSYTDPVGTYDINIMGTINILEAIRNSKSIQSAVIVTTDKCYENNEWEFGYRETDPLGGHDPYSSSKGCAELVIKSYQKSFFNDQHNSPSVSSVRAGNVIGGGDFSKDRLIPDLFNSLTQKKELILRNPYATRPWQHVLEPLHGYIKVAETAYENKSLSNDCWNFGPLITDIRTVQDVTELFCASWGGRNYIKHHADKNNPHEAHSLSLDISKAFLKLDWHPKWNLKKAVLETVNWYKAYYEEKDMLGLTNEQIERYSSS